MILEIHCGTVILVYYIMSYLRRVCSSHFVGVCFCDGLKHIM